MANEFKVKNGLIVIGDLTTSGTITINGALAATQSWVTSQAYLTSASLSGYATQSYVTSAISALIDAAPAALDTLNELAAALGDDANFSTSITNSIASKQAQLNGTGFVKVSGTTVSYDNSTYLTSYTETDTLATVTARGNTTATAVNFTSTGGAVNLTGPGSFITFKDQADVWTGYVGFDGNLGRLEFPGRNVRITSGWNGTIELNTGTTGQTGYVTIPYGHLNASHDVNVGATLNLNPNYGIRKAGDNWIIGYDTSLPGIAIGSGTVTDKVSISSGGTPRVWFDTNGNVGIGTSNPSYKLDVATNGLGGNAIGVRLADGYQRVKINNFDLLGYSQELWMLGNSNMASLLLGDNWDWDRQVAINYQPGTSGAVSGILSIGQLTNQKNSATYTHGITRFFTNGTEAMRINSAGNVGIGTTNPIYKLQVVGSAYVNGGTLFLDSSEYLRWGNSNQGIVGVNDSYVAIVSGGTTRQTVYASGYTYFPGLDLSISNVNSSHSSNYFRGDASHLVIGTGGTLYLNYANTSGNTYIFGNTYINSNLVWHAGNFTPGNYLPLSGGTLTGQLSVHYTNGRISIGNGTDNLIMGAWDGVNQRVESNTRPIYIVSYGGTVSLGRAGGNSLVVNTNSLTYGGAEIATQNYVNTTVESYTSLQSQSDFVDGTLVITSINASVTDGNSFVMEVSGKSYSGGHSPYKLTLQGYIYGGTFISNSAISYGTTFPGPVKILEYGGNLAFWWPRGSYWNSFDVYVRIADGGNYKTNTVTSIINTAEPSSSKKVSVTPFQSWTTWHFGQSDINNWNTAYSWGNHATAGYLTSVSDVWVNTTGDTMTGALTIQGGWASTILDGDNVVLRKPNYSSGGWARTLLNFQEYDTTSLFQIGGYGNNNTLTYGYLGSAYNTPTIKWYSDKNVYFSANVFIDDAADNNRFAKGSSFLNLRDPWNNTHLSTGSGGQYYDAAHFYFRSTGGGTSWLYLDSSTFQVYREQRNYARVEFRYNADRYSQSWYNTNTGAYWWVTTDSDKLGLHLNGDGDKFYFGNNGDFYSTANGWLSSALAAKQNASTAINTSNIGSQSVNYANSAGSATTSTQTYRGIIEDTRAGERTPNDYDDYRVSWEFTNQIPGLNYGGTSWWSVMTMQGWHNGYSAWQIIGSSSSAIDDFYLRAGNNTTWNTARRIWHSGDFSSTNVSNWNTAYGWGNHASAGYLTSVTAHTQAWSTITSTPTTISGYGITNAYTDAQIQNFFSGANSISGYNKSNWDTAYSWGNHASQSYATTSYVTTQINNLINGAPGALDTLDELAAALGDDANFATTVTNSIASKLSLSGGTMTGQILFQTSALNNGFRWDVNSDAAGITFKNTGDGDNNSYFNFFTEDNGNEYFKFSHNTWNIGSFDFMDVKNGVLRTNGNIYVNASQSGTRSAGTNELINGNRVWHDGDFSSSNVSNWNTAYGWGNHASAGYALNSSLANYLPLSGGVIGGVVTINGNLTVNGTITENSSIKLKENVQTSEGNLEKVVNLRPVTYNKIGSQTKELGLIAEEVAEVYPEFVQYDENGEPVGVHYSRLTAALIGAVKELTQRIETLENNG